ncbi:unnamed protein product, partial [Polarella glacialis]
AKKVAAEALTKAYDVSKNQALEEAKTSAYHSAKGKEIEEEEEEEEENFLAARSGRFSAGNWRDGEVDAPQAAFIRAAQSLASKLGLQVWYDVCSHGYVWDHLLTLFHVLPGRLLVPSFGEAAWPPGVSSGSQHEGLLTRGFREADVLLASDADVRDFLALGPRHLVLATGGVRDWLAEKWGLRRPEQRTSTSRSAATTRDVFSQVVALSHGADEDHFWGGDSSKVERGARFPTLQFTRYMQRHRHKSAALSSSKLLSWLRPGLPTLLYLATSLDHCSSPAFLSPAPTGTWRCEPGKAPSRVVMRGLRHLCSKANVIVRPHPQDLEEHGLSYFGRALPGAFIDDYRAGRTPGELAELADVLVGEPSAATAAALRSALGKPLVYLLRDERMYSCVRAHVLNDDMAEVFFPDAANSSAALFLRVLERARARDWRSARAARSRYLRRYHGRVDGFEEYRLALRLLELGAGQGDSDFPAAELRELRRLLRNFSHVPLWDTPRPPPCNSSCCKELATWM